MEDLNIYSNGIELPVPTSMEVESLDVHGEKSGRDENSIMHVDRIRQDVRSVSITWEDISSEEVKLINDCTSSVYFTFSYPADPITGMRHSINCYRGNRKFSAKLFDSRKKIWGKVSLSFIEV